MKEFKWHYAVLVNSSRHDVTDEKFPLIQTLASVLHNEKYVMHTYYISTSNAGPVPSWYSRWNKRIFVLKGKLLHF